MPTRTAFVITIGDVIDSRPPQTRSASSAEQRTSMVNNNEVKSSDSEAEDQERPRKKMKTRHVSASSSSSLTNGNKKSLNGHSQEDEEVSFSDSAFEPVRNGFRPGPACSKKRKSGTEKFLEDNDSYYGIQSNGSGPRSRSSSVSAATVISGSKLRVNVKKIDEKSIHAALSGTSSGPEEETESAERLKKARNSLESSPNKKRRSELDKLLEAGSSSFHFETARQTATRLGNELGPIHVDVKSEPEAEMKKKRKREKFLLKKVSPHVKKKGRPAKNPPLPEPEEETEDESDDDVSSYFSKDLVHKLDKDLKNVSGEETPIDNFVFSFERTPVRESWFQTYTRQDQGDEFLYYPDPRSFLLPYEMPLSTFYPNKKDSSLKPSGTVTPSDAIKATRGSQKLQEAAAAAAAEKPRKGRIKEVAEMLADRKSPRCHASTKSLISSLSEEVEVFDECSNDSTISKTNSPSKKTIPVEESSEDFREMASQMEWFFTQPDPLLDIKRKKKMKPDHMDQIVASNIDQVLLDCLEDELPSVPIPDEIPGSSPIDLIMNYENCTSMRTRWNLKPTKNIVSSNNGSRKSSLADEDDSSILKKLLSTAAKTEVSSGEDETGSSTAESTESETSGKAKKKRKRNLTGFPVLKKKKKKELLTTVLKQNAKKAEKAAEEKKTAAKSPLVKVPIVKKSPKKTPPKRAPKAKNVKKRRRGTLRSVPAKNYDEDMDAEDEDDEFVGRPKVKKFKKLRKKTSKEDEEEDDDESEPEIEETARKKGGKRLKAPSKKTAVEEEEEDVVILAVKRPKKRLKKPQKTLKKTRRVSKKR